MTESKDSNSKAKNIESIYPLSPMQEGLLFHSLMNPGTGIYLLQYRHVMEIDNLNIEAFIQAWDFVFQKHELLRTSFVWKNQKQPLQVVHKTINSPVEILDWQHLNETNQREALDELLKSERETGFEFTKAPLMRVKLIKLSSNKYQFLRSYHHILMDAWCFSLIMMDFLSAYRDIISGRVNTPTIHKPVPYSKFIQWLQRQDKDKGLTFWRDCLAGFDQPTFVPLLTSNANDKSNAVEDLVTILDEHTTDTLNRAASSAQVTLNTLIQGAWSLLLSRYSQTSDIVFGVTVAGRPASLPDMSDVVGLFINTIPLRVNVNSNSELTSWLKNLFEDNLLIREYEQIPLADIQKISEIDSARGLFDTLFVFENAPFDAGLKQENLEFLVSEATNRTHTNYPYTVVVIPGKTVHLQLSIHSERVDKDIAQRMLQQFSRLVCSIAQHICSEDIITLGEIPLLNAQEIYALTQGLNAHSADLIDKKSLEYGYLQRVQEQVLSKSKETLLIHNGNSYSYEYIDKQSSKIAHSIFAANLPPESVIAVLGKRSADYLSTILGILKAGCAFLPLDPAHPKQRHCDILTEAQPAALILLDENRSFTTADFSSSTVTFSQWHFSHLQQRNLNSSEPLILPSLKGNNLAYVIYTSGSTGKPKGVLIEHKGMLNNMLGKLPELQLDSSDVIAQTASQAFDISVWQLLTAPILGAKICIVDDEDVRNPSALTAIVEKQKITILEIVPALIQSLLDQPSNALQSLCWVMSTGEALSPELAKKWLRKYPQIPLMNAYGPAECSDDVAFYPLKTISDAEFNPLPIGRATANLELYVLDSHLQPVPVGAVGEIYVAGIGVGRGYHRRADLTEQSFLLNPFKNSSTYIYRTGDLGSYNCQGVISYHGRIDGQVKIRGFRIEVGEIENCIEALPDCERALVIVEGCNDTKRLVAYVQHKSANASNLKQWTSEKLPSYMVPSTFIVLDKMPLNANGKIDKKALPKPDNITHEIIAPNTEQEQLLHQIWCDVLGITQFGVTDNFFELGGHSLLATQITARACKQLQRDVDLKCIFQNPTIRGFLDTLDSDNTGTVDYKTSIQPIKNRTQLPLSFNQQRLWFLYQLDKSNASLASYNMPSAVKLTGHLDTNLLLKAVRFIVDRHEVLRLNFAEDDQGHAYAFDAKHNVTDIHPIEITNNTVLNELKHFANTPFNLEHDALFAVKLYSISEDESILAVVLHHIIADGWSVRILLNELSQAYRALIENRDINLNTVIKPLSIQYSDYAQWANSTFTDDVLTQQVQYWQNEIGGEQPLLNLPLDKPRPNKQSYRGQRVHFDFHKIGEKSLSTLCSDLNSKGANVTIFNLLLSAYQWLLHGLTGQSDIRIGIPVAERQHWQTQDLIGFFINTQVIKSELNDITDIRNWLLTTNQKLNQARQHQDVPFEKLVDAINPERQQSFSPIFQAMLNVMHGNALQEFSLPGLAVEAVDLLPETAMFDITLDVHVLENSMKGSIEYASDLFNRSTIEQFINAFEKILHDFIRDIDQPLSTVSLIEFDATKVISPTTLNIDFNRTWLHRFNDQLHAHGDQTLLIDCQEHSTHHYTYNELNQRAEFLCQGILATHSGENPLQGCVVALLSERNVDFFVQVLSCFKLGAAYLPLDPKHPSSRHLQIIKAGQLRHILIQTDEQHDALLYALSKDSTVNVSDITLLQQPKLSIAQAGTSDFYESVNYYKNSDDLAYVIFTSGSTGEPKGACVTEAGMLNNILSKAPELNLDESSVIAQTASQSFDISVWQLLTSAIIGAKVCILGDGVSQNPDRFIPEIDNNRISIVEWVPSLIHAVLTTVESTTDSAFKEIIRQNIRYCLPTGEALSLHLAQQWFKHFSEIPLINAYGPAECADDVATAKITPNTLTQYQQLGLMPIGRATANNQVHILDTFLNPVPNGVIGEICVSGIGVGKGYLNNKELTQKSFVDNPWPIDTCLNQSKLYLTGDLGRMNAFGEIEYVGRKDFQIKLRGYRIELGEIEYQLELLDKVTQAVACVKSSEVGETNHQQLIAYVVCDSINLSDYANNGDLSLDKDSNALYGTVIDELTFQWRNHLLQSLPEYMVPNQFIVLADLPHNANGKVDRKQLPEPNWKTSDNLVPANNHIEATLLSAWQQLLNRQDFGITDNFFALGGDSIQCLQLTAKLKELGLKITPSQVFEHQTICRLAKHVEIIKEVQNNYEPIHGSVKISPIQYDFIQQKQPNSHHWNMAVALEFTDNFSIPDMQDALHDLAIYHDMLRVVYDDKSQWQFVRTVEDYANTSVLEVFAIEPNTNGISVDQAINHILDQQHASLNLCEGRVFKCIYLQTPDAFNNQLIFIAHHWLVDAISWRILIEDFYQIYSARLQARSNNTQYTIEQTLPAKSASYQEWVNVLSSKSSNLDYWQILKKRSANIGISDNFADLLPVQVPNTQLSTEQLRNMLTFSVQKEVVYELDKNTTQLLLEKGLSAYGLQVQDILLTALALTLNKDQQLWIELESHGRQDLCTEHGDILDISRTVGWFTRVFPVVITLGENISTEKHHLDQLIKSTKENLRTANNQSLDYSLGYLHGQLTDFPRPKVTFNYYGNLDLDSDANAANQEHVKPNLTATTGKLFDDQNYASSWLELNIEVKNSILQLRWRYSQALLSDRDIENTLCVFDRNLRAIIEHCCHALPTKTPSDFPLLRATQADLDELSEKVTWQDIQDIYPLSPVQSGIYLHTLLEKRAAVYVDQVCVDIQGNLNLDLFQQSWDLVFNRHDILRSAFIQLHDGKPVHLVYNSVALNIKLTDLEHHSEASSSLYLNTLKNNDINTQFDLSSAPVMRLHLVKTAACSYKLIWTHHHVQLDGWCAMQLITEVLNTYRCLLQSNDNSGYVQLLSQPATSFKEYIRWIDSRRNTDDHYWREQLGAISRSTSLPLTTKKITVQESQPSADELKHATNANDSAFACHETVLPKNWVKTIEAFAAENHLTLNTLYQSAWALLLAYFDRQESLNTEDDTPWQVVLGLTTAGRPAELSQVDTIIGMFINTLPMVLQWQGNEAVGQWLTYIQDQNVRLREHEHSSLANIQKLSAVAHGQPLFENLMVFENFPTSEFNANDINLSLEVESSREFTHYPITFTVAPGNAENTKLHWLYKTDIYNALGVQKISDLYVHLLQQIVSSAQKPLADINFVTDKDLNIWQGYNNTHNPWLEKNPAHKPALNFVDFFETKALAQPNNIAITDNTSNSEIITYQTLSRRSAKLAKLIGDKIGPTDTQKIVAVCLPRESSLICALLAVLKSGHIYLPIDPDQPSARRALILESAQADIIITNEFFAPSFEDQFASNILLYDEALIDAEKILTINGSSIATDCAHNTNKPLAYILYTSGSTGKPKGVSISHLALCNFLLDMGKRFNVSNTTKSLAITTLGFDISGLEIWLPLMHGGEVVLADDAQRKQPVDIIALIKAHQCNLIQATPATWSALFATGELSNLAPFTLLCGGEALIPELGKKLTRALPANSSIYNVYGPTETTIWSTSQALSEKWQYTGPSGTTIIGEPIANTQCYLLDEHLKPVPVGCVGNLYIAGDGVGEGYYLRDDLTRNAFVPNNTQNLSQHRSNIMYKTGDLARLITSNNCTSGYVLDFMGRGDFQVKIRGHRIELCEIENVLLMNDDVEQVTVIVQGDQPSERLVAFFTTLSNNSRGPQDHKDDTSLIRQLSELSKTHLPHYMQPSVFTRLDKMPLNANGKIDRKALPKAEIKPTFLASNVIAPKTNTEFILYDLWRDLLFADMNELSIPEFGITDNFFQLGGHSLIAMQLQAKVNHTFGVKIDLADLFEEPTIQHLACTVEILQTKQAGDLDIMDQLLSELE
ncbi:amino acid adenylation domain-containing protein [Sessilibacter sp. MAH4]